MKCMIIIIISNLFFIVISEYLLSYIDINLKIKVICYFFIVIVNISISILLIIKSKLKFKLKFIMLIFFIYFFSNIFIINKIINNEYIGDIDIERELLNREINKFLINSFKDNKNMGNIENYKIFLKFNYKKNRTILIIVFINNKNNNKIIFTHKLKYLKKKHILKKLNKYNIKNMKNNIIYINIYDLNNL